MIYLFLFILCHGLVVLESKINDEDSSVLLVLFSQIVSVFSCVIAAFFSGRYMCFHTSGAAVPITGQVM